MLFKWMIHGMDRMHYSLPTATPQDIQDMEEWCSGQTNDSTIWYHPIHPVIHPITYVPIPHVMCPGIYVWSDNEKMLNLFLLKWAT